MARCGFANWRFADRFDWKDGGTRGQSHVPTCTDVRTSSSDARLLSPGLLPVLIRLVLRGGRPMKALAGRGRDSGGPGDMGGEDAAMAAGLEVEVKGARAQYRVIEPSARGEMLAKRVDVRHIAIAIGS